MVIIKTVKVGVFIITIEPIQKQSGLAGNSCQAMEL